MRALVISTVFPDPTYPTHGIFVLERVRWLARLAEVRVIAPVPWFRRLRRRVPGKEERSGLAVWHPGFFYVPKLFKVLDGFFLFLSILPTALLLRRRFDFDLIDAHFAYPEGFASILLGRVLRRPVTVTLRGTLIPLSRDPLRRKLMAWTLRRADRVIAVAEPLAQHARALGAPPARITVIANGVDTRRFAPREQSAARKALGLDGEGRLLVSVGSLCPRKGFQRVLRVLPRLAREVPGLLFAVVGGPGAEGNNGPQLADQVRRLRLEKHVILAGPQTPEAVARWLAACDVFVLASDYEGCPNVVLEAMACGRPVVVSRVGEVERMVPPEAGLIFHDPEDGEALFSALLRALEQPWDHARIRAHAEGHTWDRVAARVFEQWNLALRDRRERAQGAASAQARGGSNEA